jgi:hypothetical protein
VRESSVENEQIQDAPENWQGPTEVEQPEVEVPETNDTEVASGALDVDAE